MHVKIRCFPLLLLSALHSYNTKHFSVYSLNSLCIQIPLWCNCREAWIIWIWFLINFSADSLNWTWEHVKQQHTSLIKQTNLVLIGRVISDLYHKACGLLVTAITRTSVTRSLMRVSGRKRSSIKYICLFSVYATSNGQHSAGEEEDHKKQPEWV